jgi:hypothetical protein
MVIENGTGICLFEHKFSEYPVDENLLAGLLHGLQQMSGEVFQQGQMEEIKFEHGILLFKNEGLFTAGLISSRTSLYLKQSIARFAKHFTERFARQLESHTPVVSEYATAGGIAKVDFDLIPA